MFQFLALALLARTCVGSVEHEISANQLGPGRSDRMLQRRAVDYGTFQVDCKGSENACNNACYYIRCLVRINDLVTGTKSAAEKLSANHQTRLRMILIITRSNTSERITATTTKTALSPGAK
jgi:hypothetical protein